MLRAAWDGVRAGDYIWHVGVLCAVRQLGSSAVLEWQLMFSGGMGMVDGRRALEAPAAPEGIEPELHVAFWSKFCLSRVDRKRLATRLTTSSARSSQCELLYLCTQFLCRPV